MSDPLLHIRFGPFELDEAAYQLRASGEVVPIEPRPLALLFLLARNRERVMRREELLQALWPDATVGVASLSQAVLKAREALGEVGSDGGAIQTVRGVGFRFVAEAEGLEPVVPASPPPRSVPSSPDLVGREAECEQIAASLSRAVTGAGGRVLFVTGPAGIGKTRLVTFAAVEGERAGAEVHRAGARDESGSPAFWLWVQLLRSYAGTYSPEDLAGALGPGASDLARLVPEFGGNLGREAPDQADADEARFRLLDAIARFLAWAAGRRPQVLLLEDLHWADPTSLSVLSYLAAEIGRERILIVATFRDDETDSRHPLVDAEADCARHEVLERAPLRGLDADGVSRLVADVAGFAPSEDLSRAIHARTGGNPFFVKQIVSLDVAEASGSEGDPAARLEASLATMPREVRRVVGRRLDGLSQEARSVLAAGAVLGRTFSLAPVVLMNPLSREALVPALDEAVEARAIEALPGAERRYRFVHDLLQEVVYGGLDEATRLGLHRSAADALESLHAADLEAVVPALARHYAEAAPLLEGTEAVDHAKWAGELARDTLAYEEAARFFDQALKALDLTSDRDPRNRAELLVLQGFALQSCGEHESGREVLREAFRAARVAGEPSLVAASAVGLAEFGIGFAEGEAIGALEEAKAALDDGESALHVWLFSLLATNLANDRDRLSEADRLSRRAEAIAEQLAEPRLLSLALSSRAAVQRLNPECSPTERAATAARSATFAASDGDSTAELLARLQHFGALLELGDLDEVDAEYSRIEDVLLRLRSPYWAYVRPSLQSMRALLMGRFEESEQLALEAYTRSENPRLNLAAAFAGMLAGIRLQQGRLGELAPVVGPIARENPKFFALRAAAVQVQLASGDAVAAGAELARIAEEGFDRIVGSESWLCALTMLAEVAAAAGEGPHCEALAALLEPRSSQCVIVANGHYCHGPVSFYLGLLSIRLEDWDAAEAHLDDAAVRSDALRSPVWKARVLAAQAVLHRASGHPRRARAARAQALEIAETFGTRGVLEQLGEAP